jgi:hypothetical protein
MEAADRLYGVTMEEEGVSKLVSVALDGELKGEPKALKKRTQRQARAAALLAPTAESLAGLGAGDTPEVESSTLGGRRAGARLDRAAHGLDGASDATGTALLEAAPDLDDASGAPAGA